MPRDRNNVSSSFQLPTAESENDAPPKLSRRSPSLPNKIMVEILSWLPVKCLFQAKCVCKSWNSIISKLEFVKKHLQNSIRHPNLTHHRLLAMTSNKFPNINGFMSSPLQSVLLNTMPSVPAGHATFMSETNDYIVGTCNGIICMASGKYFENVSLWNPSTKRMNRKLPTLFNNWRHGCSVIFGFGYDHSTEKYAVVSIFCDPYALVKTVVKVYTLGMSNTWRQIQSFPYIPKITSGKFVSGCLNWLATRTDGFEEWKCGSLDKLVVSLELGKETYKEILLPVEVNDCCVLSPGIGILRDCLCFSYDYIGTHFVVWMMMEYGVKQSWTRLFRIPYLIFEKYQFNPPKLMFLFQNGELLMQISNGDQYQLTLYNPRNRSLRNPPKKTDDQCFHVMVYVESLVSPYD